MIYGSGNRSGFANTDHVPSYTQVNLGISREYLLPGWSKPTTLRFDVVNLFDQIYQIRDGSGIGVFAPQFGPRRGFFVGISHKL
jgi:outer membrane receptor protein involved in Fe transport